MNKKRIRQICMICVSVIVLSATGCTASLNEKTEISMAVGSTGNTDSDDVSETTNEDTASKSLNIYADASKDDGAGKTEETIEPAATKDVPIYTINEATQEVESVIALVEEDKKLTPELIVDLVTDSMSDRLVDIGIDEVTTQGDTVIVSFLKDQPPLTGIGRTLEKTILDAIAQSLVDNLTDYSKVIFRAEGKAYESENYKFGINQVYLDGTKTK